MKVLFAVFKTKAGYICHPAMNTQSMGYQACLDKYGLPTEHFSRHSAGAIPKTWRGKPMDAAEIIYSEHHPASGWATEAECK